MATTETLLDSMTERATATTDELRSIAYFIGGCAARRELPTLTRLHDRIQRLRRVAAPGSELRGFADAVAAYLDSYFATLEPTQRLESLAREVEDQPLWREILASLQGDRELNQVSIAIAITARAAEVPTSKTAISLALEDLRDRELVEYVPSRVRRERVHALTRRGQELCAKLSLTSGSAPMPEPLTTGSAGSMTEQGPSERIRPTRVKGSAPAGKGRAAVASKATHASGGGMRKVPTRAPEGNT